MSDQKVRGLDGFSLRAVDGRGVGELDLLAGVGGWDAPVASPTGQDEAAVVVHGGDGPGVSVGDVDVALVTTGGDPVADPEALPRSSGECRRVVDATGADEVVADGSVEAGDLFAGVGDHERRLPAGRVAGGCDRWQRVGALDLGGVEADLVTDPQCIEDLTTRLTNCLTTWLTDTVI